jgi:hypothetical protein
VCLTMNTFITSKKLVECKSESLPTNGFGIVFEKEKQEVAT